MRFVAALLCLIFTTSFLQAQDYVWSDVKKVNRKNFGTIYDDNEITGYYYYQRSEKLGKGIFGFDITVLDKNLERIASESITLSKKSFLVESVFNGKNLLFKFYDPKLKKVEYRLINGKGKISESTSRTAGKLEHNVYTQNIEGAELLTLYTPNNRGFIDLYEIDGKATVYAATYISNGGEIEWTYSPRVAKGIKTGSFMTSSPGKLVFLEATQKNKSDKNVSFALKTLDLKGNEIDKIELLTDRFRLMPHNAFYDELTKNFVFIGEYSKKYEKTMKAESLGIFLIALTDKGEWGTEKFLNWKSDIKPKLSAKEYADSKGFHVYFHDIVRTADGNIIAVAEQYKKRVNALAAASLVGNALNGQIGGQGAALAEIVIGDMVFFEIGSDLELKSVNIFDKKGYTVELEEGMGATNKHYLGRLMKAYGRFDYVFNQMSEDKTICTFAFTDRVREKGKLIRQAVVQFVSYDDKKGSFTNDKMPIKTDANRLYIDKAKEGNIMVFEYWRKSKRATIRLVPINI